MKWYIGLYERTGIMAKPWVERGYNALCVDLDAEPGIQDGIVYSNADINDWIPVREIVEDGVAFVAAFPPCDHLAVSGARWFAGKGLRALSDSIRLFERAAFWSEWFGAPYLIENPVSTISSYWRKPDHIFHPWEYCGLCPDDVYTIKTCLWTGGGFTMPPPQHPDDVEPDDRIHKAPPGPERAAFRSATPAGFAEAVAQANSARAGDE